MERPPVCRLCHREILDARAAVARGTDTFCPSCWESCGARYEASGPPSSSGVVVRCPACGAEARPCHAPHLVWKVWGAAAIWLVFSVGAFAIAGELGSVLSLAGGVGLGLLLRPQLADHWRCRLCGRAFNPDR